MTVLPQPSEVIQFLNEAAGELDRLGKEIEQAHIQMGDCEAIYEEKRDEALLAIVEEYEAKEKRLPGEDVRLALAHKRMDFQTLIDYRKSKRLVEGLSRRTRLLESAVNARQSTLRGIREAMSSEGFGSAGETFGGRR